MPSETTYSKYIWDYLMNCFHNEYGVAALMGNLYAESGLRPNNLQNTYETSLGYTDSSYTSAVDSGAYSKDSFVYDEAGYGRAQWTYWSRKKALYEAWKDFGYDSIADIELQLMFLVDELVTSYRDVYFTLLDATSIREASDKVLHDFESPADQSTAVEELRESYGQDYFDLYSGSEPDPDVPEPDEPEPEPEPEPSKKSGMSLLMLILATRR